MNESPVIIGEITGVFGVKGWVKVFSHTEPRDNIVKYNPWLVKQGNQWQSIKLINGRTQGKTLVAQLDGVDDRDKAHAMIGRKIAIEPSQLERLDENDFYWRDLEGLKVINLNGTELGKVSHLIETGANDVMIIKPPRVIGEKPQEMLIPYLFDSVIKKVDLENGTIEVDWDDEYL